MRLFKCRSIEGISVFYKMKNFLVIFYKKTNQKLVISVNSDGNVVLDICFYLLSWIVSRVL